MNPSAVDEASRPSAIPFLITHWLSQYGHEVRVEDDDSTEAHAIARIQLATFELAQAFADLGAFGTTLSGRSRLVPEESEKVSFASFVLIRFILFSLSFLKIGDVFLLSFVGK